MQNRWECKYNEEELNFKMDWIAESRGQAQELKDPLIQVKGIPYPALNISNHMT